MTGRRPDYDLGSLSHHARSLLTRKVILTVTTKMKAEIATVLLAAGALAAPSEKAPRKAAAACSSAVTLDPSTNVFAKYKLHANTFYRSEVEKATAAITDATLKASAAKVADVGSFLWL